MFHLQNIKVALCKLVPQFIFVIVVDVTFVACTSGNKTRVCIITFYCTEIKDAALAEGIYKQVANAYGPEMPNDLLMELFQSRTTPELGWPAGKPLPDIEQFVARDLLNEVLKEMGRKVTK